MRKILHKISDILRIIFGYGVMICLFAGGLTFFGYIAALCIGGDTATEICRVIYKVITPYIIKASTILVLLGLLTMYLKGEKALTTDKKKTSKHEGEM
ncbi:MAG: hypothetical protein IKY44_01690 [Clostridia bacterium]|nr:hypothetical protein [Clostridia bacterium]